VKSECIDDRAHNAKDYNEELTDFYKTNYDDWKQTRLAKMADLSHQV